jgi:hypothetical protein
MQIFVSPTKYAFSLNDRWVLVNACEERGCAYLRILSPEMQVFVGEHLHCAIVEFKLQSAILHLHCTCWR